MSSQCSGAGLRSSHRLGLSHILIKHCTRTISGCIRSQTRALIGTCVMEMAFPLAYAAVSPSGRRVQQTDEKANHEKIISFKKA